MTHSDHSLRSASPNLDRVGPTTDATPYPDDAALANIEAAAREFIAEAGAIVLAGYTRGVLVEYKDKRRSDPVTEIDRAVESYLTGAVGERFPEQAVLGEEGQDPAHEHEYEWIVDPVDGTHNFVNGLPLCGVSIGVLHRRRPVVGVLLFPALNEELYARRGGGAFRNDEAIHVRQPGELGPSAMGGLSLGFPGAFKTNKAVRHRFGDSRSLGSMAYEIATVATGVFDYTIFRGPKIWDVAAGATIVPEAGGEMLRYSRIRGEWLPVSHFAAPPAGGGKERRLRDWGAPTMVATPSAARELAANVTPRYPVRSLAAARGRAKKLKERRWKGGRKSRG